ncbi:MarR family transcriptional regulator [Kineosporia sp. J2-2]|uniref:MarR family transcriptional regulator n=1 Tax=Kineosporia corallincola TaxID=2835133 RepID=A0ABS5TG79_9ACTN|nr:MarR family transcriptional regulator [Kineosporia corallincola]MBT0770076.1 MarR family transcriptional regulator [Kineosporia corallincola]
MTQATGLFLDLVRVETRLYNTADARLRADSELTLGQFQLLDIVGRVPNCRVNDIVRELAITVGATSKAVDRVESAGLLRREANPGDRRSSILTLTSDGATRLEAARPVLERILVALTADVVAPDDLARTAAVLSTLRVSLERLERGS